MNNLWQKLNKELNELKSTTKHFVFGKSEWGTPLVCFELGSGDESIILHAGIHAREFVTSFLLIKLIKYLKNFYLPCKVLIIPVANPDGTEFCLTGKRVFSLHNLNKENVAFLKKMLKNKLQHLYKANGKGVDLNVNFDCDWGEGKHNFFAFEDYQNFVGKCPNSASETKALVRLTKKFKPFLTISYHSKGEVVYYGYKGQSKKTIVEQKNYLKTISKITSYKKIFTKNSCGGYKDYCLIKLDICSFTLEVGSDLLPHPIGIDQLDKIFRQNKNIVLKLVKQKFCKT